MFQSDFIEKYVWLDMKSYHLSFVVNQFIIRKLKLKKKLGNVVYKEKH